MSIFTKILKDSSTNDRICFAITDARHRQSSDRRSAVDATRQDFGSTSGAQSKRTGSFDEARQSIRILILLHFSGR